MFQELDLDTLDLDYGCKVKYIHIEVPDVSECADEMIKSISNTSWIDRLGVVERGAFRARSTRTIDKLVYDIFNKIDDVVTADFGEFMVSHTALLGLVGKDGHTKFPLAELWKEKVTGNPGFDFHSETPTALIAFGEAKFSAKENPYTRALKQIAGFIVLEKDLAELTDLKNFSTVDAIQNGLKGNKAFVAAFSLNSADPAQIFQNVFRAESFKKLLDQKELYLIGVSVPQEHSDA